MKKIISILIVAVYFSTAYAQGNETYIGFSAGKPSSNATGGYKEKNISIKVFAGVEINKNVAIEAHYSNRLNQLSNDIKRMRAATLGVAAIYKFKNSSTIIPFAKLGYHHYKEYWQGSNHKSGKDLFYGIGAMMAINKTTDLRVEIEGYRFDNHDIKYYSIGVSHKI